jgi:Domain of unknown function (DUF4145)
VAFDSELWGRKFSSSNVPALPCPSCAKGNLQYDKRQFWKVEPRYSADARSHEDWEPSWISERFTMFLKCDVATCGEVVVVSGSTSVEEVDDEEFGPALESLLIPTSMAPPPPIIQVPEKTPKAVKDELQLAFQLFWADLGASATKIRTSVERLMDHFKVSRFKRARGKLQPIALYSRIEAFIAKNGKVVHKDHLHALRVVGNVGTHSNAATRSDVLEAFQIYEHALDELIGKKSAIIAKLAKKLKGK